MSKLHKYKYLFRWAAQSSVFTPEFSENEVK